MGIRNRFGVALVSVVLMSATASIGHVQAEPWDPGTPYGPDKRPRAGQPTHIADIVPLAVFTPTQTNWQPKYPFPFDKMRNEVTADDVKAGGEICQWFQARYDILDGQIETLSGLLGASNSDYDNPNIQQKADILTANLDQAVDYLAPRAEMLSRNYDFAGDIYFPMFQAVNMYGLWQQMHNVNVGIKSRQPAWVFGPPNRLMGHFGSRIEMSRACK